MLRFRDSFVGLSMLGLVAAVMQSAVSCPFCSAPSLTLTEQVSQADAVVLAQWVSGVMPEGQETAGSTVYEIVSVVKDPATTPPKKKDADVAEADISNDKDPGSIRERIAAVQATNVLAGDPGAQSAAPPTFAEEDAPEEAVKDKSVEPAEPAKDSPPSTSATKKPVARTEPLKKGEQITLVRYRSGKKGDLFLLTGTMGTVIEWGSPLEVTETSFNYITQAPSTETPTEKRLAYFVKFLEFPDQLVSNDAYGEFANASYKHITLLKPELPRDKLRKWVADPQTPQTRLGLYGMLLGLCGTPEDAELMEKKISEKSDGFRLGVDGIIGGYLLLKGEKGLDFIEETKLRNREVPFSETYAAMQALRFIWNYGEGVIEKERLRASMRTLLDRPELADLVIADLARWQDWSVQDKLMSLYDAEGYDVPSIKRAVVRYMLVSAKFKPKDEKETPPAHVEVGKKHVETLRERDPKTVKDAERFFYLD